MVKQWLENLKNNVKARRNELGLSQQALAEKAKLAIATITKIEQGTATNVTLDTIAALGKGLEESNPLSLCDSRKPKK